MTTKRFAGKVVAYSKYYHSGAYEQRYKTRSLRVLTVTLSQKRLEHLKAVTEKAGGDIRFWFAVHNEISPVTVLDFPLWWAVGTDAKLPLVAPLA